MILIFKNHLAELIPIRRLAERDLMSFNLPDGSQVPRILMRLNK
jgi:hypothetical protein